MVGRFVNADNTIAGVSDTVGGYNLFAYCFNNPINMKDSNGNWPRWITATIAVVAAVATVAAIIVAAPAVAIVTAVIAASATLTLVSQTIHYDVRQSKNIYLPDTPQEADAAEWRNYKAYDPITNPNGGGPAADFHQYTAKEDKSNVKYVSPDGKREVIYNKNGDIVNDPRDVGTYNFVPSGDIMGTIGHIIFDVLPWIRYGNDDDDWGIIINIFLD